MTPRHLECSETGQQLKSIIDYVQDCERRVLKGEIMDLQGLDRNVVDICNAIAALPPKDARALEGQMTQLIEGLEILARSMKSQQEKYAAAGGGG